MTLPFQRVGIDIVSAVSPPALYRKYNLVVIDYATHYPKAMPLHNIWTKTGPQRLFVWGWGRSPNRLLQTKGRTL